MGEDFSLWDWFKRTKNVPEARMPTLPLSREDLASVERDLGITIPEEVKAHYLRHNGETPDPGCWILENGEAACIAECFPIKHGERTLESVYKTGLEKGFLTKGLVPFANDWGGNYFCFDERGQAHFYAMDAWSDRLSMEENKKKAASLLTESFKAFIQGLVPDPSE